jgi:thiamine kinase-like enzyme
MNLPFQQERHIRLLLEHIENSGEQVDQCWQGWRITRLSGGRNNLLFRARRESDDIVVKFTIRDERNRAEREFLALSALEEAGLEIAPRPLLFDDDFRQPVVVQTWIDGETLEHPPVIDEEWRELLRYYQAVHSVTPETSSLGLSKAFSASSVAEGCSLVDQQLARIPIEAQPKTLEDLIRRFGQAEWAEWERVPVALCRIDPNVSNFIRSKSGFISVDWEYSGWGDPAFDIADLMAHPTYIDVDPTRWPWIVRAYGELVDDPTVMSRIETYYRILLVWWVARSTRFLYEVPRSLDNRLASQPADWETKARKQYDHYLELAQSNLDIV